MDALQQILKKTYVDEGHAVRAVFTPRVMGFCMPN